MAKFPQRYDSSGIAAVLQAHQDLDKSFQQVPVRSRSTDIKLRGGPPSGIGTPQSRGRNRIPEDLASKVYSLDLKIKEQEKLNSFILDQMTKFEKVTSPGDSELIQMRNFIQEKLTEDQKVQLKNKEKSQVLFGEVVRLGESHEKMNEFLQNLSITVEGRVSQLESRLNHGERQVVTLDTKSDTNVNLLIELAEKVEKRVQMVETALLALGNEQVEDHKIIDKVEIGSQRLQEDLKLFLRQLQGDIQHRVELKTGDLLNRLIQEQEERLRTHQDLKYTFDVKEKMTHEKMQFDREEFRDRLGNLETLMRTEFQRKEEMINHLNANLDMQIRSIFEGLKQEEGARFQGEANLRDDLSQVGDAARDAIEQFKSYQASITEKMTEMVKTEIECRLKAEKDLKQMIQNTTKGIFQELSSYKDAIEKNRIKAEYDTKEASKSFSEKADILSRYIEEETQRVGEVVKNQHQQTKEMITTITESLKQTIISNEKFKSDVTKKFIKHDQSLQILKNELTKISHMGDSQITEKMRELQASLESHLGVNTKILEDRIENLASMVDISLGNFEKALYYNRETFSDIINKLNDEISEQHQCMCEDLEKLLGGLETLQLEIDSITDDLNEKLQNVAKQTALIESQTTVQLSTEKLMREHMINKFSEEIEEKHRDIDESLEKLEERLEEEEKVQQGNDDRNLEKFAEIGEEMGNIVNSLDSLGMELGKIEEIRAKNQEEVLNLIKDPVVKAGFENIQSEVWNLKQGTMAKENEFAEFIEEMKNKINDLQYKFDQNSKEVRDYIQEVFDRKIVGLHEKLQRDNEILWNSVVATGRNNEIKTKGNLSAMHDKIMKIANNSEGYKPKIRGFKQD